MRRIAVILALLGCLFTSFSAVADCGGCDKPKDDKLTETIQ